MISNPTLEALGRRLRLGVIGGSHGFIGPVHRTAARLDDRFEIVAGVLSSDPQRGLAAATGLGIAADRAYGGAAQMIAAEARRADGIDAVWVNGVLSYLDGKPTGERAGKFVARGATAASRAEHTQGF